MATEDRAEALRVEIQRLNAAVEPVELAELQTRSTVSQSHNGSEPGEHDSEIDWLVPTTKGDPMMSPRRWTNLAAIAAAVLLIVAGAFIFRNAGDANGERSAATDVDESPTPSSTLELPTPLEIVERRYEAMNALDFDAVDADVSESASYCRMAFEGVRTFEGCLDSSVDFFGPNGRAERIEIMALRVHAYGGAIEYSCEQEDGSVTCTERESHLLLDAAQTEYEFATLIYDVVDGEIVYVEDNSPTSDGLITTQVRPQELAYVDWLNVEYPEEVDALTVLGRPAATRDTAARHRQLVTEWHAALQ